MVECCPVGLVCSDAELVQYYVQLITEVNRFNLKAIWCPDTERSIQIAADSEVPSVSHTAYQLISRNDLNTVIIAGYCSLSALFALQALALDKRTICVGAVALSTKTGRIFGALTEKKNALFRVIYPLRYSAPFQLMHKNMSKIGTLESIDANFKFQSSSDDVDAKRRLYNDLDAVLHRVSHDILDAFSSLCTPTNSSPQPIIATCKGRRSLVQHFRLQELQSAYIQVSFGLVIANIRIASSSTAFSSLSVSVRGEIGSFLLDDRVLLLERREGQGVLWRGDSAFDSTVHDAIIAALEVDDRNQACDELTLVNCVSNYEYL